MDEKSNFNSDHMCKGITLTEGIAKLLKMFGLNYHCVLVFETFFRKLIRNKFHCQIEFCQCLCGSQTGGMASLYNITPLTVYGSMKWSGPLQDSTGDKDSS